MEMKIVHQWKKLGQVSGRIVLSEKDLRATRGLCALEDEAAAVRKKTVQKLEGEMVLDA